MRFVLAEDDCFYNLSEIVSYKGDYKRRIASCTFRNGETVKIGLPTLDSAAESDVVSIFTAEPGTFVLAVVGADSEGPASSFRRVVVGWAALAGGTIYPITAQGIQAHGDQAILFSSGRVETLDGAEFSSFSDWEAEVLARANA